MNSLTGTHPPALLLQFRPPMSTVDDIMPDAKPELLKALNAKS